MSQYFGGLNIFIQLNKSDIRIHNQVKHGNIPISPTHFESKNSLQCYTACAMLYHMVIHMSSFGSAVIRVHFNFCTNVNYTGRHHSSFQTHTRSQQLVTVRV